MERNCKDMGDIPSEVPTSELVAPQLTGKRAVVHMQIDVLVEVQETADRQGNLDWNDMIEQAKDQLRKRVVEGKGFLPFRSKGEMIHDNTTVDSLQHRITIQPQRSW